MPILLTSAQMRAVDRAVIENLGLPGLILMENAGRGVARIVLRHLEQRPRPFGVAPRIRIVCGAGQNGGDGLVVARHLLAAGMDVAVLMALSPDKIAGDAAVMAKVWRTLAPTGTSDLSAEPSPAVWGDALTGADVVVDAIFGTGLRSAPMGAAASAIAAMNAAPASRVCIDLPSGLCADTGKTLGIAVRADVTATIAAHKRGLWLDASAPVGRVELVPFGVGVDAVVAETTSALCQLTEAGGISRLLPVRKATDHKGSAGHVLVVAGSVGKTGAAILAGRAALRAGAGLATLATVGAAQPSLEGKVVAEMTAAYAPGADADDGSYDLLRGISARMGSTILGPGIPTGPGMKALVERMAREWPLPMVIDADALNLLGTGAAAILAAAAAPRVLTPHPGEMGRLLGIATGAVGEDRLGHAMSLAERSRAVVVLKGARTVIADSHGATYVNPHANPALATAGSGDVLAGVVGAFLACGLSPSDAARAAVFVHGHAAELAAAQLGTRNLVATDLPEAVGRACEALRPV